MSARGHAALLSACLLVTAAARETPPPAPTVPPTTSVASAAQADAVLLAGAASRPITPEIGGTAAPVVLAGFSEGRVAEGVLDDIEARALVLEAAGLAVTLVALDLYGLGRDDARRIQEEIRSRVPGAAGAGIVIACTRTHAAPDATGQFTGPAGGIDSAWLLRVTRAAADAVEEAWRTRQPARLSFATTRLPRLLTDARRPSRIDDRARLVRIESAAGRVGIAALAVFGASPETLPRAGRRISADYPGALRRGLEQAFGGVGIFLVGASGGLVLPVPPPAKESDPSPPSFGEAVARSLVVAWSGRHETTESAVPDATRATLRMRARAVEVPLENPALREAIATGRRRARLSPRGGLESEVAILSVTSGGAPLFDLACVPGEVYPELVDGGIQEPQDPAADRRGEPAERPLRSLLRSPMPLVAGACGDDLGDIVPASEWDEKPPFTYGLVAAPRGEGTSPGPRTAPTLWAAFADLAR